MGSIFKFKQFEIDQRGCAMKINTDGVLLGAIVGHAQPLHILDIGTGTGVIALMLAQRFESAQIDAVEIDPAAATAAAANFANSPFAGRVAAHGNAYQSFHTLQRYDMIVSNPPYFVNDLKNPEKRKELARHADEDFFDALLRKSAALLTPGGKLWLILPVKQAEKIVVNAVLYKLFPSKIVSVYSDQHKEAFRQILCLDFNNAAQPVQEHVYIYEALGKYTPQYQYLLKDFFLAF